MQERQAMFSEFKAASKKDWHNKLTEDLKGTPYQSLQWHTYEGFTLEPYYTRSDLRSLRYLQQLDNAEAKAAEASPASPRQWVNNQYIRVKNEKEANAIALDALNKGADGIFFDVSRLTHLKLDVLLKDIYLNHCSVSFMAGSEAEHLLQAYLQYASDQGIRPEELHGMFHFDPVGEITDNGLIDSDHFQSFRAITNQTISMPHFYGITVNTSYFHDAGASAVQEIAFSLNIAVSYLDNLTEQGMTAAEAVQNLCLSVSIGTSYFMEIAKLRAIRWLFSKIVQSYGLDDYEPGQLYIHAKSDTWSASVIDPHVNMLRQTTQAMSAILGGCNALTMPPFDISFADPSHFSRRISRNISTILKEEAYFDKVTDAAAGSYYIETMTDQLVENAWKLFLRVEEKGGFSRAFEKGFIQNEVRRVREEKLHDISQRKQKLVGVNAYCQPEENIPAPAVSALRENEQLLLPLRRGLEYEKLRLRTETYMAAGHARPHALLLQFGDPGMRRARAAFATDFLRCAGFTTQEVMAEPEISQLPDQLQEPAEIIVFCAADADYEAHVPEMADEIRKHFGGLLIVAGRPAAMPGGVKYAAIDGFINMKSDALDVLHEFQDKLFAVS